VPPAAQRGGKGGCQEKIEKTSTPDWFERNARERPKERHFLHHTDNVEKKPECTRTASVKQRVKRAQVKLVARALGRSQESQKEESNALFLGTVMPQGCKEKGGGDRRNGSGTLSRSCV